jgi:hypothetical protein
MTCNSSFVAEFDVQMRPRDTLIEATIDTKARIGVQIKPGLPRNAFRTAIRPTFPVRRIADCQALASQDVQQRQQRAKLAVAILNRSRLALKVIEADPQMVFTRKKEDQAPSIRQCRFRAILERFGSQPSARYSA